MNAEKYAGQMVKYLKCSGGKKKEIKKQITSDIQAAAEEGSSLEQIIRDMGDPKELAAEFNESFSEAEKKAAGRAKLWKLLIIVVAVLAVLAALIWWVLPKTRYLSDSRTFSEEQVRERAELIIECFNAEDYVGLQPYLSEQMDGYLSQVPLGQLKLYIGDEWGEMINVGNIYLLEVSQMWQKYAVVQMNVSYEKVGVTYTMNFDKDLKLTGFYLK